MRLFKSRTCVCGRYPIAFIQPEPMRRSTGESHSSTECFFPSETIGEQCCANPIDCKGCERP